MSKFESSVVEQSLSDVVSLVSLGDTNISVPGRIKGKMGAYEEAGASQYVLDTIREGYKLVFLDNVFPLPVSFGIMLLHLLKVIFHILNLSVWNLLVALVMLPLGPIL